MTKLNQKASGPKTTILNRKAAGFPTLPLFASAQQQCEGSSIYFHSFACYRPHHASTRRAWTGAIVVVV